MDDPGPVALTIPILLLVLILVIEEFIYLIRAALNALSDTKAEQLLQSEKTAVRRLISRKDDVFLTMSFTSVLLTLTFATIAELAFGTRLRSV
ncbi:MAG: hypothetical protein IJ133_05490, partial [Clostridia bacterium]|nr:hypothetical protein [Clostridia bacterium]